MLIIADRGFFSYQVWSGFLETGADLLFRAWSTMKLTPVEVLADGTWIAEICKKSVQGPKNAYPSRRYRRYGWLPTSGFESSEYQISGHRDTARNSETFRLIATILDPQGRVRRGTRQRLPSALGDLYSTNSRCNCLTAVGSGRKSQTWWNKNSGDCWSVTTRYAHSCTRPQTLSISTRIKYPPPEP